MDFARELQQIKGIGPGRVKRLCDAGFDSYSKILQAGESELKAVRGMGKTAITVLLGQAKQVIALDETRQDQDEQLAPPVPTSAAQEQPRTFHPFSCRRTPAQSPSGRKRVSKPNAASATNAASAADAASAKNATSVTDEAPVLSEASAPDEGSLSREASAPIEESATKGAAVLNEASAAKETTVRKKAPIQKGDSVPRRANGKKQESAPRQASGPKQASASKPAPATKQASISRRNRVPKQAPLSRQAPASQQKDASQSAPASHQAYAPQQAPIPQQPQAPQQAHGMHLRLSQLQERIGHLAQSARSRYSSQLDCKSGRKLSVEIATIETALLRMHESGAEWPVRTARALVKVEKRIDGLEDVSLKKFCKCFKKARKAVIKGLP